MKNIFKLMLRWQFANSLACLLMIGLFFSLFSNPLMAQQNHMNTYNTWKRLLNEPCSPTEIIRFIQAHPDWPRKNNLIEILEKSLNGNEDPSVLLQWFENNPPLTVEGAVVFINILLKANKTEQAHALIKTIWREKDFPKNLGRDFRKTYVTIIQSEDDQARINRLLYKEDISAVQDMLPFLNQSQQDLVKTRLELIQEKSTATSQLSNTLTFVKDDKALTYNQIKWNRRQRYDQAAIDLITSVSAEHNEEETKFPDEWWVERNILGRRMIEAKRFSEALKVMQGHKLTRGENFANAEWLIGWLQLRFLNQHNEAFQRFQNLYNNVSNPISKARAAFWAAEAAKTLGQIEEACKWYRWASAHPATYYGQLAISRLNAMGIKLADFKFLQPLVVSKEIKQRFENRELVKVIKSIPQPDKEEHLITFFMRLTEIIDDPAEQQLLVELAQATGSPYVAVQTAKKVSRTQIPTTPVAYPLLSESLRSSIHKISDNNAFLACFTHAIIRQESRFDPKALSSAGAQGLMQLMPATAEQEVKRLKAVKGAKVSLKTSLYNVEKNVHLGVFHIKHLLKELNGSLVLTIASYNAGKKAVQEWIQLFGDPTDPKVDIIDWIELIPFAETRNYVQRVMENFIVYQERFKTTSKSLYDLDQYLKVRLH